MQFVRFSVAFLFVLALGFSPAPAASQVCTTDSNGTFRFLNDEFPPLSTNGPVFVGQLVVANADGLVTFTVDPGSKDPLPNGLSLDPASGLITGLATGMDRALDELIARYGDRLCSYLLRIVRDAGWADDLVQEVFVRVYDHARTYDGRWPVRVWLFGIARNLAVDLLRREGAMQSRLQYLHRHDESPAAVTMVEHREFQAELEQAISRLPEVFRSVFILRETERLSYDEIGEVLGISAKTVSSRLHRSRTQLKTMLQRYLES